MHTDSRACSALILALVSLPLAAQVQSTVFTGSGGGAARANEPWRRSLAAMPDGSLWCLVHDNDGSGAAAGQHLRLLRSLDSGANWTAVADTPTVGDSRGVLVPGVGCDTLHLAWSATDGTAQYNLYHQTFDTLALAWIGTPTLLLQGTNSNDQYYATDIELTERGTIGIALQTHRTPITSGLTAWSGAILVRRPGDTTFQGPFRLNTDTYGVNASLQAVGEVFHAAFRTNTGLYGIRYRAFDSSTLQFTTPADVPLYGSSQSTMLASNGSCIAADADGNLYILFAVGAAGVPGQGEIRLAYATAGNYGTWTHQLVAADPDLLAGNVTYTHYGLCRGEGSLVFAVYSRLTGEQHQNLYLRPFLAGTALTPEVQLVAGTEPASFSAVSGLRSRANHTSLMVSLGGTPPSRPEGVIRFLSGTTGARTVQFGTSCQGTLPALPRLYGSNLPTTVQPFALELAGLPASTFGLLFAGVNCARPALPLDGYGLTGCAVFHDVVASFGYFSDAAGRHTTMLTVPPAFADQPFYFASLVFAPGANPGGAVTTNALLTWFR